MNSLVFHTTCSVACAIVVSKLLFSVTIASWEAQSCCCLVLQMKRREMQVHISVVPNCVQIHLQCNSLRWRQAAGSFVGSGFQDMEKLA